MKTGISVSDFLLFSYEKERKTIIDGQTRSERFALPSSFFLFHLRERKSGTRKIPGLSFDLFHFLHEGNEKRNRWHFCPSSFFMVPSYVSFLSFPWRKCFYKHSLFIWTHIGLTDWNLRERLFVLWTALLVWFQSFGQAIWMRS